MNTTRSILLILFGMAIGLTIYHFILCKKGDNTKCPPFTIRSKKFIEDTVYRNYFFASNSIPDSAKKTYFFTKPVDTTILSGYVRNYKREFGGTYCFVLSVGDVTRITNLGSDIRVYLGLMTPGDRTSGTVMLTGVNAQGGDMYIVDGTTRLGIDEASPCPKDCPYSIKEAVVDPTRVPSTGPIPTLPLNPFKSLLGRLWDSDPRERQ